VGKEGGGKYSQLADIKYRWYQSKRGNQGLDAASTAPGEALRGETANDTGIVRVCIRGSRGVTSTQARKVSRTDYKGQKT